MGENNNKWNNWLKINLQNIQAFCAAWYQKNKQPSQKLGRRPKQTFLQRRHTDGYKKAWKDPQHHSLLEKCKSTLPWDTTSHRSEWSSSENPQTINAGEGVEEKEPSCTVAGNVNDTATVEDSMELL